MTTQEFVKKMEKDEELCQKMRDCKKPEEAYELAKAAGVMDDLDVFMKFMTQLNEQMSQELSGEELENVVGGISDEAVTGIALGAGVAVAIGSAAAA